MSNTSKAVCKTVLQIVGSIVAIVLGAAGGVGFALYIAGVAIPLWWFILGCIAVSIIGCTVLGMIGFYLYIGISNLYYDNLEAFKNKDK